MERRRLGRTGAHVGTVGLGTATWGRGTDDTEATAQVDMLLEAGGNLIDLSTDPAAARCARAALADAGLRRHAFVNVRLPAAGSQADLLAALDDSLSDLGLEHADMWTVEGWDASLPWAEMVSALAIAVSTGRARYVGLCPMAGWHAALVGAGLASHPDRTPLASLTAPYSLLDYVTADEAVAIAQSLDAGVLAAWPLAGGVLTGKYRHATPPDSRGAGERHASRMTRYRSARTRPVIEGLCAAAEGLGTTPAVLAQAWVRDRPGVSATVIGARTVHQWRAALAADGFIVPAEIRQALDEVAAEAAHVGDDGHGDDGYI